jgi:hypothetical protein
MAMEMVLRRMGLDNVTVHGFRSAFRDWAGNETHFPREVAEAALASLSSATRRSGPTGGATRSKNGERS